MAGISTVLVLTTLICMLFQQTVSVSRLEGYNEYDGKRIATRIRPSRRANVASIERCARICEIFSSIRCTVFSFRKKGQRCIMYDAAQTEGRNIEDELTQAKGFITFQSVAANIGCIEVSDPRGVRYAGKQSETRNGKTCQSWVRNKPHRPNFRPIRPALHKNYCRNPDGDSGGPWCYTMDPAQRWGYCPIPKCSTATTSIPTTTKRHTTTARTTATPRTTPERSATSPPPPIPPSPTPEPEPGPCFVCNGEDYIGTLSRTVSGITCQAWNSSEPHQHSNLPSRKPDRNLEGNYCRNPDGDVKPWCYTTDPATRWEYCNLQRCTNSDGSVFIPRAEYTTRCKTGKGTNYRGKVSTTRSGFTCAQWSSQTPHEHSRTPDNYPCSGLERNYCRNPSVNFEEGPWCYTADPSKRWELCDIPECGPDGEPIITTTATSTRATTTTTPAATSTTTRATSRPTPSSSTPRSRDCGVQDINPSLALHVFEIAGSEVVARERKRRSAGRASERILGGDIAVHGSWPWSVSLRYNYVHFCGGTLIKPQWVLTASHCLDDGASVGPMTAKVGHDSGAEPQMQERNVERYLLHEDYSKTQVANDIALVKLRAPFVLSNYVKVACLPPPDYIVPGGSYCVVTGWGNTYDPNYKNQLKQAVLPVHSYRECVRYMGGHMVDLTQMCAGYKGAGIDTCRGDSGGPLVCLNDGHWTVQGVTSWGSGCEDKKGSYGSYTRVSKYVNWINSNIA